MNFTLFLLRRPSAFLPLGLSAAALGLVVVHYAWYGITHDTEESTPAHVFQLLMVVQCPVIAFFAIRWLPTQPKLAAAGLALQVLMAVAAIGSVLMLT